MGLHSASANFHEASRVFNQMSFVAERTEPKRIWPGATSDIGHDCRRTWQESLHNSLRALELKLTSGRSQPVVFGVFSVILLYGTFRVFRHCGLLEPLEIVAKSLEKRGSLDELLGASPDKSTA